MQMYGMYCTYSKKGRYSQPYQHIANTTLGWRLCIAPCWILNTRKPARSPRKPTYPKQGRYSYSTMSTASLHYCLTIAYYLFTPCRWRVVFPGSAKTAARRGPSPMLGHDSAVTPYPTAQSPARAPVRHRLPSLPPTTHKNKKLPAMYITSIISTTHISYWTWLHVASLVTQSTTSQVSA